MNKLITKIVGAALGLTMAIGVGVAVASNSEVVPVHATEATAYTMSISKDTGNSNYASSKDASITSNAQTITWNIPGNQALGDYTKLGGKLSSATTRSIYSKGTISQNITRIVVSTGAKDSQITVTSMTVTAHDTAANAASGSSAVSTFTFTYAASSSPSATKSGSTDLSAKYWRFNLTMTSTASSQNKGAIINSITFYYDNAPAKTLSSIAVTTPPTKTNYYVGDSFDPAGMVVTAYYDDLSTSNVTNNVQITPTTLQLTDEFVTITYLTKSTTQPITVSERTFYTATLQYTGSTGNMTTGNNASSVGLNPTIFNVVSTERYPNPIHVGLNKDGQVRLYSGTPGNILTVSLQSAYSSYTIKSIKFSFGSSVTTAKIKADTDVIHDGSLTGNSDLSFGHIYSNQFSIENTGSSQIYILSIEINYLTSEQAALDFANEVMTGIGNNAESNCEVAYATLESIYGSLNTVSKALFDNSTEEIYSDARARMAYLQAWTAANTQSGDSTAGNVISDTREKSLSAALIIGLFGLTSLAGYYFLQKRKVI